MTCPKCGKSLELDAVYCIYCGAKITDSCDEFANQINNYAVSDSVGIQPQDKDNKKIRLNFKLIGVIALLFCISVVSIVSACINSSVKMPYGVKWGFTYEQVAKCDPNAVEPRLNSDGDSYTGLYLSASGDYFGLDESCVGESHYGMTAYNYDESRKLEAVSIMFGGLNERGISALLSSISDKFGKEPKKKSSDFYEWENSGCHCLVAITDDAVAVTLSKT